MPEHRILTRFHLRQHLGDVIRRDTANSSGTPSMEIPLSASARVIARCPVLITGAEILFRKVSRNQFANAGPATVLVLQLKEKSIIILLLMSRFRQDKTHRRIDK